MLLKCLLFNPKMHGCFAIYSNYLRQPIPENS